MSLQGSWNTNPCGMEENISKQTHSIQAASYVLSADIVQMLGGERILVYTRSLQNDMRNLRIKDDILTLLIHLGYLGYDSETKEAFIPNKEITGEFENAMSVGGWPEIAGIAGYVKIF